MRITRDEHFTRQKDVSLELALAQYNKHYNNAVYCYLAKDTETGIIMQDAALYVCGSEYHSQLSVDRLFVLLDYPLATYWLDMFRRYAVMAEFNQKFPYATNSYILPEEDSSQASEYTQCLARYRDVLLYSDKETCAAFASQINDALQVNNTVWLNEFFCELWFPTEE